MKYLFFLEESFFNKSIDGHYIFLINLFRNGLSKFFLFNIPLLKENAMSKLFDIVSLKWVKNLKIAYKRRQERKKIAYFEKRWDMKLRGLR